MQEYVLPRSGNVPIKFKGVLIARSDGEASRPARKGGSHRWQWHVIEVYRTAAGKFILSIQYKTQFERDTPSAEAIVLASAAEVAATLRNCDPTANVAGFPPIDRFKDKQARLMENIRSRFDGQVAAILAELPGIAETVD